jgi:hypothetical protein
MKGAAAGLADGDAFLVNFPTNGASIVGRRRRLQRGGLVVYGMVQRGPEYFSRHHAGRHDAVPGGNEIVQGKTMGSEKACGVDKYAGCAKTIIGQGNGGDLIMAAVAAARNLLVVVIMVVHNIAMMIQTAIVCQHANGRGHDEPHHSSCGRRSCTASVVSCAVVSCTRLQKEGVLVGPPNHLNETQNVQETRSRSLLLRFPH